MNANGREVKSFPDGLRPSYTLKNELLDLAFSKVLN